MDIGATHNYIADEEANRLVLKLAKSSSRMNTVNLEMKPMSELTKGVDIKIGAGDDFQFVLGVEFLQEAKAAPMSLLNSLSDGR